MKPKGCEIVVDALPKLTKSLKALQGLQVLVGIASGSKTDTRQAKGITNAQLGWIHEKGSPSMKIPPRPFLVPSVKEQKTKIVEGLKTATEFALKGDESGAFKALNILGMTVRSGVMNYMETANFEPLKPSSIENRRYSRGTKSQRDNEIRYIMKDGKKVPNPKFGVGIKPLINTGQLRNAIDSYVVKGGK